MKAPRSKPKILLVEDSTPVSELLQLHLETAGYDVLLATDGSSAIQLVTELKPDLAIVDLNMPHLSGDEFVAALRSDETTKDVPVIFVSARDDLPEVARLLGAVAFMRKPILARHLVDVVAQHVVR